MSRMMRQARRLMWIVPIVALITFVVILTTSALGASEKHFNRMAGWATIFALIIAAGGLIIQIISWIRPSRPITSAVLDEHARAIAEEILIVEERTLRRLVSGDEIAHVRFQAEYRKSSIDESLLTRLRELVRFTDESGNFTGDISSLADYFRSLTLPRMTVLGPPGAGKTIMLISLVIQLLRDPRDQIILPIRAELAGFNPFVSDLSSWLASRISVQYRISEGVARRLVETGRVLPVLDGLDEMDASNSTFERGNAALRKIDAYIAGTELGVVVASREIAWRKVPLSISGSISASVIHIQPLNLNQIRRYVRARLGDEPKFGAAWEAFLKQVERRPNSHVAEVLSRPLWLYLAVLEFRTKPSDLLLAADTRNLPSQLLSGFVSTATKESVSQRKSTRRSYDEDTVRRWLHELACFINESPTGEADRVDIVPDRLWLIAGAFRVRLLHALLASVTGIVALLLMWPAIAEIVSGFSAGTHGYDQGLIISLIAVGVWLAVNILRNSIDVSAPPLFVGFSFRKPKMRMPSPKMIGAWFRQTLKQSFINGYLNRLILSALLTLPFAVFELAIDSPAKVALVSVSTVIILYISFGLFNLILSITFAPAQALIKMTVPQPLRPYDTLRRDRFYWLCSVVAFPAAASAIPPFSWSSLLDAIVLAGLLSILIARASIRYAIAVTIKAITGRLPLRLHPFLHWAVDAGLLREAGPSYQFRHVELQRWLAPK